LQAKLIESFQNYDIAHAPMFPTDGLNVDDQLLIDARRFQVTMEPEPTAEIEFSVRVLDKSGKVIASRLFEQSQKIRRA
jgi:phospholipid/cholesterol/gamma-HCH transport system substrate-binding protein